MCEPVSIAVGLGMAISGVANGIGQQKAAEASAQQDEANAVLAEVSAKSAIAAGESEVAQQNLQTTQILGAQKTAYAAGGVDVAQGSALDVAASTRASAALDAETTRRNAELEAWGLKQQAINMRKNAKATREAGRAAMTGSILGGMASGAGSAYQTHMASKGGK